jgi:outer membrane immunogenic protein
MARSRARVKNSTLTHSQLLAYAALTLTRYEETSLTIVFRVMSMKKFVFALTLVSALAQPFASVLAADFEPPPPPTDDLRPASYDWSGMYAGASLGATCIDGSADILGAPVVPAPMEGCGGDLFGYVGYNYQMDHMVFGFESEIGIMSEMAKQSLTSSSLDITMATGVKGRMGYAWDNTLFYGLAGYNWAQGRYGEQDNLSLAWSYQDKMHHGWSVGMGVEHAITDVIRLRAEYAYMMLNSDKSYVSNCGGCSVEGDFGNIHSFRVGVSYAF